MQEPIGGRLVTLDTDTDGTSFSPETHRNRITLVDDSGGAIAFTMPVATGSGDIYRFVMATLMTTGTMVLTVAGTLAGKIIGTQDAADTTVGWEAAGANNTITLNGTTKGGQIGDWIELCDIAADLWELNGCLIQTGTEVTPISTV